MSSTKEQIYCYETYRKYNLPIDDKTELLVKFTNVDDEDGFLYSRSFENSRKYLSPYEVLHKIEEDIRDFFFKNHELPEAVCKYILDCGETEVIFELEDLYEKNGYYEAVYSYSTFVS